MYDVITIGTATRDVFLKSPFFKILKDPAHLKKIGMPSGEAQCFALGGKIEVEEMVLTSGGGATNAAVTFARQGLKAAALIRVGKDEAGGNILKELEKEGIRSLAVRDKKSATAYSTILLSPGGERTILVYRGAGENFNLDDVPFRNLRADWVYIVPGGIDFKIVNSLVNHFAVRGINIAINPSRNLIEKKLEGLSNILKKSKVVILNREEASYLSGIDYGNAKATFKKIDKAVPGIVVVTDGKLGVMVSDGRRIYGAGIFSAKGGSALGGKEKAVVDRTGAGDAFGSGFVAGLIHRREKCHKGLCSRENIEYAIRLGSANATSVVEHVGAKSGILTKSEFKKDKRWKTFQVEVKNLL